MTFRINTEDDKLKLQALEGEEVVKECELKQGKNYIARELCKLLELEDCPRDIHKMCFEIFRRNLLTKMKEHKKLDTNLHKDEE